MARFVIVGAGGVGGLLGAHLALAGHEVAYVARGANLSALRERGLTLLGPDEGQVRRTAPLAAAEDPAALAPPHADFVLVALKTWQVAEMAPRLAQLVGEHTLVTPLQNGLGASEALARALGEAPVTWGLCHMLAFVEAPGVVRCAGPLVSVTLGARHPAQVERLAKLRAHLEHAGVPASVPEDFEPQQWSKLLFVAAFGAVGAASGLTAGGMRREPAVRARLEGAMEDIARLARARGVALPEDAVRTAMARIDLLPEGANASLHRDLEAGRPSELEDWLGAVVRMGADAGVPVPHCAALYAELLPRERAARARRA